MPMTIVQARFILKTPVKVAAFSQVGSNIIDQYGTYERGRLIQIGNIRVITGPGETPYFWTNFRLSREIP